MPFYIEVNTDDEDDYVPGTGHIVKVNLTEAAAPFAGGYVYTGVVRPALAEASPEQYEAICEIVDRAKSDDRSEDTDVYASEILTALGLPVDGERGTVQHDVFIGSDDPDTPEDFDHNLTTAQAIARLTRTVLDEARHGDTDDGPQGLTIRVVTHNTK